MDFSRPHRTLIDHRDKNHIPAVKDHEGRFRFVQDEPRLEGYIGLEGCGEGGKGSGMQREEEAGNLEGGEKGGP